MAPRVMPVNAPDTALGPHVAIRKIGIRILNHLILVGPIEYITEDEPDVKGVRFNGTTREYINSNLSLFRIVGNA